MTASLHMEDSPGQVQNHYFHENNPHILSHSTIDDWVKNSVENYHMYPKRVLDIKELLCRSYEEEIADEYYPDPELVTSISSHERFKDKEIRIIARLHSGFLLARTLSPDDEVIFTVLDEARTGHIISEFSWDLNFYWSNFGFRREAGFWPEPPQFGCKVNSKGTVAIIVGPPELPGATIPTTKILNCNSWTTQVMNLRGLSRDIPLWPVNVEFDPRDTDTNRVTMIGTDIPRVRYSPSICVSASLLQYDAKQDVLTSLKEDFVQSGFLQYMKEGHQFICLLNGEGTHCRRLGIFSSDTTDLIFLIDLQSIGLSTRWEYACTHVIPIYSACYRYFSVVLWMKNVKRGSVTSDVVTFNLPFVGDMLPSLKHACRAAIICHLSGGAIQKLPLPDQLLNFLASDCK